MACGNGAPNTAIDEVNTTLGLVTTAGKPDGIEQHPRAIEIDAIALVEIEFSLAGDDRRQRKITSGRSATSFFSGARHGKSHVTVSTGNPALAGFAGATHVLQGHAGDVRVCRERPSRSRHSSVCGHHAAAPKTRICKTHSFLLF